MTQAIEITRVAHVCENRRVEADVDSTGKYWWGYVDGIQLKASIPRCPFWGDRLPQEAKAAK